VIPKKCQNESFLLQSIT